MSSSADPPYGCNYSFMDDSEANTNFRDPQTFHDRVLLVEGEKFYIQSGLLSVWSEFFRGLFNSDFKEKNADEIKIEELSADELETFLRVVYSEYFDIGESHLEPLVRLSHRFLAPKVMTVCRRFIDKNFEKMDKPQLLDMACRYDVHDVKKRVLKFIDNNDDFRLIGPFLEVAFQHELKELEAKLRKRDTVHSYNLQEEKPKANKKRKLNDKSVLVNNMEELKIEYAGYKNTLEKSDISMEIQDGIISNVKLHMDELYEDGRRRYVLHTVERLLFSEALELNGLCQPHLFKVLNSDADDAKTLWKHFGNTFPDNTCKIYMNIVGCGDMLDYNVRTIGSILTEVVPKIIDTKPGEVYIYVNNNHLTISKSLERDYLKSFKIPKFEISFANGWNLPSSYGIMFPLMLKNLSKDLNLFIIFDLPYKSSIEAIFKQMRWTFDDSSSKLVKDYEQNEGENSQIKDVVEDYYKMGQYNKFTTSEMNTEVTYFYLKQARKRDDNGRVI